MRFYYFCFPINFSLQYWIYREANRQNEIKELTSKGIIPHYQELEKHPEKSLEGRPWLMGSVSAMIKDVLPAKVIIDNMISEAVQTLEENAQRVKHKL